MKTNNRFLLIVVSVLLIFFISCSDDDGYSLGNFTGRVATVKIESSGTSYVLTDTGKSLLPIAGYFPWSELLDGDRIAINYTILDDNYLGFDQAIKVNAFYKVLTKKIESLDTEEQNKTFGNDIVWVYDMWVGEDFLNIKYGCPVPNTQPHLVSLVQNNLLKDGKEDGYLYLEYRYNAYGDILESGKQYLVFSLVSFNLKSIEIPENYKGLKIQINSAKNGIKVLTYNFKEAGKDRAVDFENEIKDLKEKAFAL